MKVLWCDWPRVGGKAVYLQRSGMAEKRRVLVNGMAEKSRVLVNGMAEEAAVHLYAQLVWFAAACLELTFGSLGCLSNQRFARRTP